MTLHLLIGIHGILGGVTRRNWLVDVDREIALLPDGAPFIHLLDREYKAAPLPLYNRWVKNPIVARSYVRDILVEIEAWQAAGFRVALHFLTHSNGACIAVPVMLSLAGHGVRTTSALFIAGALHSDVEQNGLAELIDSDHLGRSVVWWSSSDRVIAPRQSYPGPYGSQGARGHQLHGRSHGTLVDWTDTAARPVPRYLSREFPRFTHSQYFDHGERLQRTVALALHDLGIHPLAA